MYFYTMLEEKKSNGSQTAEHSIRCKYSNYMCETLKKQDVYSFNKYLPKVISIISDIRKIISKIFAHALQFLPII